MPIPTNMFDKTMQHDDIKANAEFSNYIKQDHSTSKCRIYELYQSYTKNMKQLWIELVQNQIVVPCHELHFNIFGFLDNDLLYFSIHVI